MAASRLCQRHRSLRVDTVLPENRDGAASLASALLDMGHRHFAILAGPRRLTTVSDRIGGFRVALGRAGVHMSEDQIIERRSPATAATSRDEPLRRARATCVFAVTDVMAIGALTALRDNGVTCPADIHGGLRRYPYRPRPVPPLTTVALPLDEMGERVMNLAVRAPGRRKRIERIAGEVILRASTAAPAGR